MGVKTVNMHEAKTSLSQLVASVEKGEDVVICRSGKPVARLVPLKSSPPGLRPFGGLKGKIWMAEDFNETPAELLVYFNGEE